MLDDVFVVREHARLLPLRRHHPSRRSGEHRTGAVIRRPRVQGGREKWSIRENQLIERCVPFPTFERCTYGPSRYRIIEPAAFVNSSTVAAPPSEECDHNAGADQHLRVARSSVRSAGGSRMPSSPPTRRKSEAESCWPIAQSDAQSSAGTAPQRAVRWLAGHEERVALTGSVIGEPVPNRVPILGKRWHEPHAYRERPQWCPEPREAKLLIQPTGQVSSRSPCEL